MKFFSKPLMPKNDLIFIFVNKEPHGHERVKAFIHSGFISDSEDGQQIVTCLAKLTLRFS